MSDDARAVCRNIIRGAVPAPVWNANEQFCNELLAQIKNHPLMSDPLKDALGSGKLDNAQLKHGHLEFRYAFAQTFTDALLRAMFLSNKLEPALGPMGKVAVRFLLQFNLLDELGFTPATNGVMMYGGTPENSHYVKFHETLHELGLSDAEIATYVPSEAAVACHRMVDAASDDLEATLAILAIEETIFESFATPWAANMRIRTGVDTTTGYHSLHIEHDGDSLDDHHAEDLWYVLRVALNAENYARVRSTTADCLDTVHRFVRSFANA
jgi:hypothetical protein